MTPEPDYEKIKDVIYVKSNSKEDLKGIKTDKILTVLLVICVLLIWYAFR